jgi:multidrug resistance efflux pump
MPREENAKLELPAPVRKRKRGRSAFIAVMLIAVAAGASCYVLRSCTARHTPSAVIEKESLLLGPQVPGRVAEISVRKGQRVSAGQALMRFDPRYGRRSADEDGAQAAARDRLPLVADSENAAERAANIRLMEQEIAYRIAQARALEDEADSEVRGRSEEHASSQLELRRLDLLSARYSVPPERHEQARRDEKEARRNLEKARAAREEYSRMRAAAEKEAQRVKTESAEAAVSGGRGGAGRFSDAEAADSALLAPTDAVVTDIFAQTGATVRPDQGLVALEPDDGGLSVTAWFPEKESETMRVGQDCLIFVTGAPEKRFRGRLERILPTGGLAPKYPLPGIGPDRHVPVRVRLDEADGRTAAGELRPGMRAAVRVYTFEPPWERIRKRFGGK